MAIPRELRDLPFTLDRSNLRPRDPRLLKALEPGQQVPVAYMPQRMGFSRWKTPPTPVAYGQNVISVLTALEYSHFKLLALKRGMYIPPLDDVTKAANARGGNRLPQASDAIDPNLNLQPVARGAIAANRLITGDQLNAIVDEQDAAFRNARENANARKMEVLTQVAALQGRTEQMLAGPTGRRR